MTAAEIAKNAIKEMNLKTLVEVWELTTNDDRDCIPMVRGWLMDEFEARQPEAFAAWIEQPAPEDKDLRNFLKF